jgi:predicted lactoylglutathione lyase
MDTMVFINLPVADLARATSFSEALGYTINPDFTDETAACVVVSGTVYVMLLTHAKFLEFTDKTIAAPDTIEVITSLSAPSKDEVHRIVDAAVNAGGIEDRPAMDLGFMFQRSFTDPDGHRWEYVWMDQQAMSPGTDKMEG